ncbi:MAG TPA: mechanosensitive ion channel domain-containing protein [Candidatus Binatia bacterium]|nr:mechanosensitive ion channel domain-containing protein [Candidatus Binatia bacterium]
MVDIFGAQVPLSTIFDIIIIVVVAIALERIISRYLSRLAKRIKLEPSTSNNLVLTFRILILIFAVLAISSLGGVQAEWLLSVSAIGGAALGFASQKTVGNFLAGLFLLAAKPFKVGDYVKAGTVEGIVQEITINYAKILTPANSIVSVSNLQILERDITNYLYESTKAHTLFCYTFEIGFDHSVSAEKLNQLFNQIFDSYSRMLPRKPEYMLIRSTSMDRVYLIYLYVDKPQDIFTLRPKITDEVFQRWDKERVEPKKQAP